MNDDLLSKMTRALADEHDGATAAPGATRSRVVRTLAEQRPRRRKWLAIGIPALTIFGGSTAWAAATGHLPRAVERVVAVLIGDAEEVETVAAKPPVKKTGKWNAPPPVEEAPPPIVDEAEDESEEEESAKVEVPLATPSAPSVTENPIPSRAAAKAPGLQAEDHTDLLTYQTAHRAHFQAGNCTSAVAGYRKYLREQPGGTFALEAKYNLGVCLIRLGETAEAKRLLLPFANGAYGNYRKEKSQELIDALK
jgi:hypothetical protein